MMRSLLLGLAVAAMAIGVRAHCASSLGLRQVADCPERTLKTDEVEALYRKGLEATQRGKMGEHHRLDALAEGLPLLEKAALHGHVGAMDRYRSHLIQAGIVEMTSGPYFWRSRLGVAEEGMMWLILGAHLGEGISAHDKETFRVLLDPSVPFPEGFLRSSSGAAWMFQMLTPDTLDHARKQAYAWRHCWST